MYSSGSAVGRGTCPKEQQFVNDVSLSYRRLAHNKVFGELRIKRDRRSKAALEGGALIEIKKKTPFSSWEPPKVGNLLAIEGRAAPFSGCPR